MDDAGKEQAAAFMVLTLSKMSFDIWNLHS